MSGTFRIFLLLLTSTLWLTKQIKIKVSLMKKLLNFCSEVNLFSVLRTNLLRNWKVVKVWIDGKTGERRGKSIWQDILLNFSTHWPNSSNVDQDSPLKWNYIFPLFLFQDQYDSIAAHTQKGIDFLEKYGHFVDQRCKIEQEYASKLR